MSMNRLSLHRAECDPTKRGANITQSLAETTKRTRTYLRFDSVNASGIDIAKELSAKIVRRISPPFYPVSRVVRIDTLLALLKR
jgi:hypothetical protein